MGDFIELHFLTSYPPSNLNRDDQGLPKTAIMGGTKRLRVSSQSLKRAWRTSEVFEVALAGHIGTRTKMVGQLALDELVKLGVDAKKAGAWALSIANVFGKAAETEKGRIKASQLVHVSPAEIDGIKALAAKLAKEQKAPTEEDLKLLIKDRQAVDIALFGRMLADATDFNVEAAAQVAHAVSVHEVSVEDDYFSAVDDLNTGEEDVGAAHIGESAFAAALLYEYICIDMNQLKESLGDNAALATTAVQSLIEAAATVAPRGKQASYASRAYASYVLAERGSFQPRNLAAAFLTPIRHEPLIVNAIAALKDFRTRLDTVYGMGRPKTKELNMMEGDSGSVTLADLKTIAVG